MDASRLTSVKSNEKNRGRIPGRVSLALFLHFQEEQAAQQHRALIEIIHDARLGRQGDKHVVLEISTPENAMDRELHQDSEADLSRFC